LKIFVLLFLFLNLIAQDDYSFRVAYGKATLSDFGEIIVGNIKGHPNNLRVTAIDAGYLLGKGSISTPLDIYVKGGISKFNEDRLQNDVYEAIAYIKFFWNFDFWTNRVRFGLGEGISYTNEIVYTELLEAAQENGNNSKFLNYIDLSLDFSVGRLIKYQTFDEVYMGWALKHRSGIFGLINNVKQGGSNYNTIYVEAKF